MCRVPTIPSTISAGIQLQGSYDFPVTPSSITVRRALVDDRDALVALWQTMQLPCDDLEKRLTEFQVAVDDSGEVVGAIGIRLAGKHGEIHSEAFKDFALADDLREAIWQRLQSVAANHGLVRLWTTETAPFWGRSGLNQATDEEMAKLPDAWKADAAQWLTLKLREDVDEVVNLDHEFALFMESEKQRSQEVMGQAKMLKLLATLLALGLFLGVLAVGIWMAMKNPGLLHR